MKENHFTKLYRTWTTDKLLDIIDNPNEYQSLAVEAAQQELENRQLSSEQMKYAKVVQTERQNEKLDKQQRSRSIERRIESISSSLGETLNPISSETPTTDKYIKLISLFLCILFLYQFYKGFGIFRLLFTDLTGKWDLSIVFYFLPLIFLTTAGLTFWFKKKIGWILTTIYFSYTAAAAVSMFVLEFNRKSTGLSALDKLFPTTAPIVYIEALLIFGGLTWILIKENMRSVYKIDKKTMLIVLSISIGFVSRMTFFI
jgi:hypothetical protein